MLTIRHFKIFQTVAKLGNMSQAAKELYVSQPTISQTILEIENHYGVKLFDRYPKKLYITPAGTELLNHVNPLIYAFENTESLKLNRPWKTTIRIGATHTVANCILNSIIDSTLEKNSCIDFHVQIDNTHNLEVQLLENKIEFALVEGVISNKDIVTVPIADDCLVLIAHPCHSLASKNEIHISELDNQNFILREKGSGTRQIFENEMKKYNLNYNVSWECSSFSGIKEAVIHNRGIGVISARMIEKEIYDKQLAILKNKHCIWKRDFFLCYHKSKIFTSQLKQFMETAISYKFQGVKCPIASELDTYN